MSGCSDESSCPRCGLDMQIYTNWKRPTEDGGECLNCGFHYWVEIGQMSLKEVNDMRTDQELPKIKRLSPQIYGE